MGAQAAGPFEESPSVFGVRVGVGYNVPNRFIENPPEDYYTGGVALGVEGVYDWHFAAPFHLHTGLNLNYDTYGMYDARHQRCPVRKLGCSVPIGLGVSLDFKKVTFQINAGVAMAVGFGGWVKTAGSAGHINPRWSDYYSLTGTSRFDLLLETGLGFVWRRCYIGLHPTIGLLHRYDLTGNAYHDLSMRLVLGRNF